MNKWSVSKYWHAPFCLYMPKNFYIATSVNGKFSHEATFCSKTSHFSKFYNLLIINQFQTQPILALFCCTFITA